MKRFKLITVFLLVSMSFISVNKAKAQAVQVNISLFQNELSPYGRWFNTPRFGQVWVYDDPAFRPYATDGHWDYTNCGWSWVSDFDWGWAPFHYGRWEYDSFYGWMWIPGYEWASAWVSWSQYAGYYGWAPLGFGSGINISFGAVPYNRWNFLPRQYMGNRDFYRYCSPPRNNYFRNAVTINNFYEGREGSFTTGPQRHEVERFTNNRIEERHIDYGRKPEYSNNNGNNRGNNFNVNRDRNNDPRKNGVDAYNNRTDNNNGQTTINGNNRQVDRNNRNNTLLNSPVNNIPERTQQNFPADRPNQTDNNNISQQRNNRFERPQEQNRQQTPPEKQETTSPDRNEQYQQRNLQQRDQQRMEQTRVERQSQPARQDAVRPDRNEQYQQRNMQQRDQQRMEQTWLERQPAGNNDRQMQQRNVPNNQSQRPPNHEGGRRQGRE